MKRLMTTLIIIFTTSNLNADILDDTFKSWLVDEDYKYTQTYKYWNNKFQDSKEIYDFYKKENPNRAIAIESLIETGAIVVNIVGIFEIGAANSLSYVLKNYKVIIPSEIAQQPRSIPKQRMNNYEKTMVDSGTQIKYSNVRVVQRDNIFEPTQSNIIRMQNGQPPIGIDGEPVQLHHMKQENRGTLVEVLAKDEHKKESKQLHRYKDETEIDRGRFGSFRNSYWKERVKKF